MGFTDNLGRVTFAGVPEVASVNIDHPGGSCSRTLLVPQRGTAELRVTLDTYGANTISRDRERQSARGNQRHQSDPVVRAGRGSLVQSGPMSNGPRLADPAASVFDRVEDILADLAAGKMVVIVDDEDRENEGDLLMAAEKVRPEDINFMARFGRGLICLTLTRERCAPAAPAADGQRHRSRAAHQFHRCPSRPPKASPPASPPTTARTPCAPRWRRMRGPSTCASPATSSR